MVGARRTGALGDVSVSSFSQSNSEPAELLDTLNNLGPGAPDFEHGVHAVTVARINLDTIGTDLPSAFFAFVLALAALCC